jgi:hypothetical protein
MNCCFCGKRIRTKEAPYRVPEGFPCNPIHELKPLCWTCGHAEIPTLDEICEKLDEEILDKLLCENSADGD